MFRSSYQRRAIAGVLQLAGGDKDVAGVGWEVGRSAR